MDKKHSVYRITHTYQIGNQDVFISSEHDPTDEAIYLQFIAETHPKGKNENIVSNLGIASALVHFYGCKHCAYSENAKTIDLHLDRERRCGEWWIKNEKNSPYSREGLFQYLEKHIE